MSLINWSVKNPTTGEQRENLSDAELVAFLMGIPAQEFPAWQARRSDSEAWFPCTAIAAFRLRRFGLGLVPAELGFTAAQLGWVEAQLETAQGGSPLPAARQPAPAQPPGRDRRSWADRRKHPRSNLRLQVVIISDRDAFRTFSRNVSMGGMALEKAVPKALLSKECTIFLSEPGSTAKFSFTGTVLAEPDQPDAPRHRIMFGHVADSSIDTLRLWLEGAAKKAA